MTAKNPKEIKDYPNYSCNEYGEVFSNWRKLVQSERNGYLCVTLSKNNKPKTVNVHRLIAETFIENPEQKPYVNHKDGNKQNNNVDNLEWVTSSENQIHAIKSGLFTPPKKNRTDISIPVSQYDLDGNLINNYPSANEAYRQTGISQKWISVCAKGGSYRMSGGIKKWIECKQAGGFVWKRQEVKKELELL